MTEPQSTTKIKNNDKHGTTFVISPSKQYLGNDCDIVTDDLIAWLEKIVYLIPSNIKTVLSVKKKGRESVVTKKYVNKYGLYDLCKKSCPKSILDPIHFIDSVKMKENVHGKDLDRFIGVECAFTYNSTSLEFEAESFCNFVSTVDGGTHVDAAKTAIMQYLTRQAKESLSEREAKKLEINFNDASQGLFLTIYLSTDYQPYFTGQTKEKLGNTDLIKPIRDIVYKNITEYFNKNPKDLKKIIDRIKTNAKARIEATKVRNSVIKGNTTTFDEFLMDNFVPANNRGKGSYRELFIIEGLSAKGSVDSSRFDRDTQAIFSMRGVPLNAFGVNLDKVLLNAEFATLVKILGCNIGTRFNINELRYDKIIIMTDADSDGYNITSLLCAFFLTHMPEIVKAGKLYKAVTPLYKLKNKYKEFILNKQEYVQLFEKQIRDNLVISKVNSKSSMTDVELQDLLLRNRNYFDELIKLANHLVVNPMILEYILIHRKDKDFYKKFRIKYPELQIDENNVMSGVHDGRYQVLIMDKIFEKNITTLVNYIDKVNNHEMYMSVKEKIDNKYIDKGTMTLGEFLAMAQKFQPIIQTRFKGLGELDNNDLRNYALNPDNRILIRLTIEDLDKELSSFNILHGNDSDERKLLMQHFKISLEDLDN